jgi:plastocyanin
MVQLKSLSLLAFAAGAIAETHTVTVGGDGDVFTPDTLTAAVGDVVTFNFKGEHSVASGDFKSPCKSSGSGTIFSGVMSSVRSNPQHTSLRDAIAN